MIPEEKTKPASEASGSSSQRSLAVTAQGEGPRRSRKTTLILALLAACLAAVIIAGIRSRVDAETRLAAVTNQAAIPTVYVVHPKEGAPTQEIVLPGTTEAFTDTPIYARTNGYLKSWHFDIGAHVRKGQLLAEIDTPEVDQQLQQARADFETAQANLQLAKTTADRWQFLVKSGSVSKQETDQAVSNLAATKAAADASAANVRRLEQLQSFEKVYAPFDGVITARNTDFGDLIDAGANAEPQPLFRMAAIGRLRVYVPVPEVDAPAARPGASALLTLDEYPGQDFHGKLVRTSDSINTSSRTLLVEVDVDNPTGKLLPGAYVFVHLQLPMEVRSVTIPSNTLLFRREGLQVSLVRGGKAQLVPVKIGRDYGGSVEIVSGLTPSDSVILDPADSLVSGTPVEVNQQFSAGGGQ
ncbi:MAG TPA: efflux RND transporter periplasmic adaptor subunit [Candidatus Aquilonibacter sp.]|nr:efflux RND transporter periplasmic adaptor subunit [Candidatus Aquilonibacter sp.]